MYIAHLQLLSCGTGLYGLIEVTLIQSTYFLKRKREFTQIDMCIIYTCLHILSG